MRAHDACQPAKDSPRMIAAAAGLAAVFAAFAAVILLAVAGLSAP